MKGIVLAGGSGSRLYPITQGVSKQLLPVYDKPMIYYPLSVLMLAGLREILLITTPEEQSLFLRLLGDGSQFGISIEYAVQPQPEGLAQAFLIGKSFLGADAACLILGDNIFYGHGFPDQLRLAAQLERGATIFGYRVKDPQRYGIMEFDGAGKVISIEEKPERPRSPYAVVGLYFYDNRVTDFAARIRPSKRGELEITDLNNLYLADGSLRAERLSRGMAWLDTGTLDSLLEAGNYIAAIERRQGLKVACLEEIAYECGFIGEEQVLAIAHRYAKTDYGQYLLRMVTEGREDSRLGKE